MLKWSDWEGIWFERGIKRLPPAPLRPEGCPVAVVAWTAASEPVGGAALGVGSVPCVSTRETTWSTATAHPTQGNAHFPVLYTPCVLAEFVYRWANNCAVCLPAVAAWRSSWTRCTGPAAAVGQACPSFAASVCPEWPPFPEGSHRSAESLEQ